MKYLAFIPARAGSKGIPGKNKILLAGKPLINYTFESASQATLIDEAHLSSDDPDVIALSAEFNVKSHYVRPIHLATDNATITDALSYHINYLKSKNLPVPENIILLQPTSPVRSKNLIDNCIRAFENSKAESLVAVSHALQHPYEMFMREQNRNIFISNNNVRRQEYPDFFFITGAVYIASLNFILSNKSFFNEYSEIFIVEPEEAVDVDEISDLALAEFYLNKTKK